MGYSIIATGKCLNHHIWFAYVMPYGTKGHCYQAVQFLGVN